MIKHIKKFINENNLDGYIIPKNDNYFTEYSKVNNLAKVTNFTGSAGFALILKTENYLFVDGRYTLQANKQSSKNFQILQIPNCYPKNLLNLKNYNIGFDPKLFTKNTLERYFDNKFSLIPIEFKFKNKFENRISKVFYLDKPIT